MSCYLSINSSDIIRPRRSRSAAAYSRQTLPWTICLSVCLSTNGLNRTGVFTHPHYFVLTQSIAHPLCGIMWNLCPLDTCSSEFLLFLPAQPLLRGCFLVACSHRRQDSFVSSASAVWTSHKCVLIIRPHRAKCRTNGSVSQYTDAVI